MPNKYIFCFILYILIQNSMFGQHNELIYIENKGQWDANVLFKTTIKSGALFLEKNKLTFNLRETRLIHSKTIEPIDKIYKGFAYNIEFLNSNPSPTISKQLEVSEYFNYFIDDSTSWRGGCKGYHIIVYNNIYPNIDLKINSNFSNPKYTFIVRKGGKISDIKMKYNGISEMKLDPEGNIIINTSLGFTTDLKPTSFIVQNEQKTAIGSHYILENNVVQFKTDNFELKNSQYLEIDPQIIFSSYSGSLADNFGATATFDELGNLYGAGLVFDIGYVTTTGAYDVSYNSTSGSRVSDIAITKFSANGRKRIYSTYIGGSSYDVPHSLIVDANDRLILLGTTSSSNYPTTPSGYQKTHKGGDTLNAGTKIHWSLSGLGIRYPNGSDIVVTKFNLNGSALIGSTYLGGSGNDGIGVSPDLVKNYGDGVRGEIILDNFGNIFIATCSNSTDLPVLTNSAIKNNSGSYDGIIAKFNANLSSLLGMTYIGGNADDAIYDAYLNSSNELVAAGGTASSNLPVSSNAYSKNYSGNTDGFICTFDNNLSTKTNTTYYGTSDYDQIYFIEADLQNKVYVFGQTNYNSGTYYIQNAVFSNGNKGQFVSVFNPSITTRTQSTTFGAGDQDPDISPTAFLVDYCKQIYIGGWGSFLGTFNTFKLSTSGLPVTSDAFQSNSPFGNGFYFLSMAGDMSQQNYGTFFGGTIVESEEHVDGGTSRFDKNGIMYHAICAGCGGHNNLPIAPHVDSVVSGTNGNAPNGNCNLGVLKFDFGKAVVSDFVSTTICAPGTVEFTNLSHTIGNNPTYNWTFSNGTTSTLKNPTLNITIPGEYTAKLTVNDPLSCNLIDTITKTFFVLGNKKTTLDPKSICSNGSVQIGFKANLDTSFSILWSPSNSLDDATISSPFASPQANTTYISIIRKGNCADTFTQDVSIENPKPLTIFGPSKSCLGTINTYTATNYPTGTYSWSTTNGFISNNRDTAIYNFPNFPAQISVSYTSIYGCLSKAIFDITSGNDSVKILGDSIVCPNLKANLTATFLAGSNYKWSTGETTNSINPTITKTTIFTVTITDLSGCQSTGSFKVLAFDTIEIKFKPTKTFICKYDTVKIEMEYLPLTNYIWSPANVIISGQNTSSIKALISTNTTFTVIANLVSNICPITKSINIIQDTSFIKIKGPNIFCRNDTLNLSANYDLKYTYFWYPTNYISQNNNKASYIFNNDQTYSCKIKVINNPCEYTDSIFVKRNKLLDDLTLTAIPPKIEYGKTAQLIATSQNGIYYQWSPPLFLDHVNIYNPITSHDTTMTFYVTVRDSMHCKSTDSIIVPVYYEICDAPEVFVPNTFTPNGDGKNDVLFVRGDNISTMYLAIYDRWGQVLFESNYKERGWDGKYKGTEMEPGVFAYVLHVTCRGGAKNILSGNITLLK